MFDDLTPHLKGTIADGVMTIEIDRGEKKNALTQAMYKAFTAGLRRADEDPEIGAVLLRSAEPVFCAGNDLSDFMANDPHTALAATMELLRVVASIDTPIVAEVDGIAVGVGVTILLHCDFVFATPISTFRTPFIDLAVTPEAGSSLLMPLMLGAPTAKRLLMLGHEIDAHAAAQAGLITAVLDDAKWEAAETAKMLAAKPREAMRATKRLMREAMGGAVTETIDREAKEFLDRLSSKEAQQVFAAFMAKGGKKPEPERAPDPKPSELAGEDPARDASSSSSA